MSLLLLLRPAAAAPGGDQTVDAGLISLTTTLSSARLDQSLAPSVVSLTATLASPQLNLSLAPGVITLALTIPAPAVAQAVTAALVTLTTALSSPAVSQSVALSVIGLATGLAPPGINQSVAPSLTTSTLTLHSPAVAPDQTVSPGLVSLAATLHSPTGTVGAADQTVEVGLITSTLRLAPDYATTIGATSGLVGYWRLGEASGSVLDSSGNGTTGSVSGGITRDVTGALASGDDGAVTNSGIGFIQFASPSSALDVGDVLTMEAWVKPASSGAVMGIVSKGPSGWLMRLDASGNLQLVKSGTSVIVTSTAAVGTGAWHHVVATKNGATSKLYIDGADVTGTVTDATMAAGAGAQLFITSDYSGGPFHNSSFDGSVDEVAVFNVALSAGTVAAHYAAGIGAGPRVDQQVAPSVVSQTLTVHSPTVAPDQTVDNFATSIGFPPTLTLFAPTVSVADAPQTVSPGVVALTTSLASPGLNQTVAPAAISLATTIHSPSLSQTVSPAAVSLATTLHAPTASLASLLVEPPRISLAVTQRALAVGRPLPPVIELPIALGYRAWGDTHTPGEGTSASVAADNVIVSAFTATASGVVTALSAGIYVGSAPTATARAVIYSDNAGVPDALLGVGSDTVSTYHADHTGAANAHIVLPLGVTVTAGTTYWIGYHLEIQADYGSNTWLFRLELGTPNAIKYAIESFADGTASTFVVGASSVGPIHVYALMGPAIHQSLAPPRISLAPTLHSPSMGVATAINPSVVSLAATLHSPVVAPDQTVSPSAISLTTTLHGPSLGTSGQVGPVPISLAATLHSPLLNQVVSVGRVSLATSLLSPSLASNIAPPLISLTTTVRSPTVAGTQTVSPSLTSLTLTPRGMLVGAAGAAPPGWTGAVEYVVEFFDSDATFGPGTKIGELWEARNIGWSRYDRLPGKAFMTLYQDSPHLRLLNPLTTHVKMTRVSPLGDMQVYAGQFIDYDSTGDDVVLSFFDYISLFAISRSGYKTMYPRKKLASEIAQVEVAAAIAKTYSPLGFITMGTIQNPVGEDGTTEIITNEQFGTMDQLRLQLLWDLAEMGRTNTANHVTFEITRTAPYTFNFWKNRGTNQNIGLILNGSVDDYQYLPNWTRYRNDIATLGTTVGGGATEIVSTNEIAAGVRGRRQDVATIKTLLGITSSTVELDQQKAATASMLTALSQRTPALQVNLMRGALAPYDGWEICDTVVVEIDNGVDILTTRKRIVGARGLYTEAGEDLGLILEPIPS